MKDSRQIILIFLAYYGITCVSNIYFLFGPFYEKMGASPQAVGLFLSIFYLVMLLCRPLGSIVMEKFDIRLADRQFASLRRDDVRDRPFA